MIANVNGIKINYEIFGDGSPILILHGWGACINSMFPIWNHLKENHKVYIIDFPGESGKSDVPPSPWGVPEYGEMVRNFMNEMGLKKVNVIGHSFGGRVIIYLASKYHDLFDKIILTDSAGVKPRLTLKKLIKKYAFKIGKVCIKTFTPKDKLDNVMKNYRDKHSSADYKALKSDVMKETFKKVISLDLTKNLKDIKNPTLLIWGDEDTDTPLYMAKIMEKEIADVGLVVLKGAKHFSYLDKPIEYNSIVDSFFG